MNTSTNLVQVQNKNFRMVFFTSVEEFRKAIQTKELYTMSHGIGPGSLIVPATIVSLFKSKGLRIQEVLRPINRADLTPEQSEDMKNKKACVWTSHATSFFMNKELFSWLIGFLEKTYPRNKEFAHAKKNPKD